MGRDKALHLKTLERKGQRALKKKREGLPKFKARSENRFQQKQTDPIQGSHHGKDLHNDEPERRVWTDKRTIS